MEALSSTSSFSVRVAPWLEGACLALVVMVVVTMGGDAVRTSYHGYLHTTLGEAVLRDGLLPENPYHANVPLHYYTLYPTLGVLLGRLGMGPLWGFAVLNMFAALLMGPALDALGRRLHLGFAARRAAFVAMVFGFNAMGWWWGHSGPPLADGAMPLLVLLDWTHPFSSFQWDARLQAFLPKFFNVSSFALSLPFALFALADNLGSRRKEILRCGILAGATLAINPLVGAWVALLVAAQKLGHWRQSLENLGSLLLAAFLALALSVPFLLPLLRPTAESGGDLVGHFPYAGDGAWANLLGPLLLLWLGGLLAWPKLAPAARRPLAFAVGLAALFSFLSLPWNNEYKFPRMAGIFLSLPCGVVLASCWKNLWGKLLLVVLAALCIPSFFYSLQAYAHWDGGEHRVLDHVADGRLATSTEAQQQSWPLQLATVENDLPEEAVLLFHPWHPGARGGGLGAQGHQLAPALHHALFVDNPQIHNSALADLRPRLDASFAVWEERRWPQKAQQKTEPYDPAQALRFILATIAPRPLAVVSLVSHQASAQLFVQFGGEKRAEENGMALWWISQPEAGEN